VEEVQEVIVYPNPTTGSFEVRLPDLGIVDVVVTDVTGKMVDSEHINTNEHNRVNFDLSDQAPGVYFIKVTNSKKVTQTKLLLL